MRVITKAGQQLVTLSECLFARIHSRKLSVTQHVHELILNRIPNDSVAWKLPASLPGTVRCGAVLIFDTSGFLDSAHSRRRPTLQYLYSTVLHTQQNNCELLYTGTLDFVSPSLCMIHVLSGHSGLQYNLTQQIQASRVENKHVSQPQPTTPQA